MRFPLRFWRRQPIFCLVGYGLHSVSLLLHSVSLLSGTDGEVVRIARAGTHFAPLERYKQTSYPQNEKGCPSPMQRSSFKSTHIAFDLFEMLFGCLLLWKGVEWLGYLDWWRTLGSLSAVLGGLGLFAHGGFSVTQQLLDGCLFV